MRKLLSAIIASVLALAASAQGMHVKQYNFTSFLYDTKSVPKLLDEMSSDLAKQHPEYGILPYNAQCKECVELIDKRTLDSRFYVNPNNKSDIYSQKSFFPLHYKNTPDDVWHTIDMRLRPNASQKGVYTAPDQPVPTKCDLNTHTTSLTAEGLEFVFNKNLSLFYFSEGSAYTATEKGNYTYNTVGQEGLLVEDIWPGINMRQIFRVGEIETEYVINAPLQLPIDTGWMVIEDHFTLPPGYAFEEAGGEHTDDGYYKGDYEVRNAKGEAVFKYEKPIYVDAMAYGMHGKYKLLKNGNDYTLQMLVPISWLKGKGNYYPLYIDPIVFGITKIGNFRANPSVGFAGGPSASMGFTDKRLGSCDDTMQVEVPGASQLTNAYVDLEYELTYDNTCGSPPEASPYCTFSQVTQEVICEACNTTSGQLVCNPAVPPYTGTCTTNDSLVAGAHPILINTLTPNYLSCIPPQCPEYLLNFKLRNRDSICGDQCGYLCARGNMWQMTIQACTVGVSITQDKTSVCTGQPVTFTAHPSCGVAPYHYIWIYGSVQDTIYDVDTYTIYPQQNVNNLYCYIFDTCNTNFNLSPQGTNYGISNYLNVTVGQPPVIDLNWVDTSLCSGAGGKVQLGGNPTASNATSIQWTGSSNAAQSWLSSSTASNPTVTVPSGTIGGVTYTLVATNSYCSADTVLSVFSDTTPKPVIMANGPTTFCQGQSVNLSVVNPIDSVYLWSSNGGSGSSANATQNGSYDVTVTDQNQCTGVSNIIPVTVLPAPPASAGGPFKLCEGGTITLGGNPTTVSGATVQWTASTPAAQSWMDSDNAFTPTVTIPPTSAGNFFFALSVTDAADGNCPGLDTAFVDAFLNPVPVIDSSGPTSFCAGGSVVLSVTGNYASYVWDNNAGTTTQIKVTQTGQYDVTVTDQNGCTGVSNTIAVLTTAVPPFQVYPDTIIEFGDSVMLSTNANLSSASIDSFNWYPNITISCLTCDNPVVTPIADQIYGLIIYANGCSVSDSALIRILYPDNFFIPNAFTPNGDGNNDNFYIATQAGVKVSMFQVFDRWGEKVHDGVYPWDGYYKGKLAPPAVYTYLFKLELFGEELPLYRKGTVTLIR